MLNTQMTWNHEWYANTAALVSQYACIFLEMGKKRIGIPLLQKLQRLTISQWWSTYGMGGWVRCNGEDHNWLRWCSSSSLFWPHWPRQLWEWQNHWSQARAKFCRQVTSIIWIQIYLIQSVIRRTPGRLLDLSLPSPVPDYGLHLGGESLLLGLAHTLPPLRGSSSSPSLDPPLHLPTSGRIFEK